MVRAQPPGPDPASHTWLAGIDRSHGPVDLAIADAIGQAITSGALQPGDRLPPHRTLALELGIDLATVTRAYAEARRRGLLQGGAGRGSFARPGHPPPAEPAGSGPVDLTMNLPPRPAAPALRTLLRSGLDRLQSHAGTPGLMTYHLGPGTEAERIAGAAWLRPLLGEVPAEHVVVCPGAQAALAALLTTLARSGDTVAADRLTYPGIRALATQLGIRLAGVPGDAEGMLPDALEKLCRTGRPKALYVVPTIHNPTTATMPAARRRAIADLALRFGVAIIEDDPYGLLPAQPPAPIAASAAPAVYYVASLSKVLSPGLRTAYLVAPGRAQAARIASALLAVALGPAPLLTGLVTAWMQDGFRRLAGRRRARRGDGPAGPRPRGARPVGWHPDRAPGRTACLAGTAGRLATPGLRRPRPPARPRPRAGGCVPGGRRTPERRAHRPRRRTRPDRPATLPDRPRRRAGGRCTDLRGCRVIPTRDMLDRSTALPHGR